MNGYFKYYQFIVTLKIILFRTKFKYTTFNKNFEVIKKYKSYYFNPGH